RADVPRGSPSPRPGFGAALHALRDMGEPRGRPERPAASTLSPRMARRPFHRAAAGARHHDLGTHSRRSQAGLTTDWRSEMPFISAKDGTQLYWHDWGQGAPMLFLNSLGMSSQMWDYQMTAFAEQGFRCIGF